MNTFYNILKNTINFRNFALLLNIKSFLIHTIPKHVNASDNVVQR